MKYRYISDFIEKTKKSILLLGPRQTGKSTLLGGLKPDLLINLADEAEFLQFSSNPNEIKQRLSGKAFQTVVIDEIQRVPSLLNTIQTLIDGKSSIRFLMTGSSARKLRRGQANLLPGRIHVYQLGPFCSCEWDYQLDEERILSTGSLPGIYLESEKREREKTLQSYASTYLKEEIQAEALTRNLEGFSRFLFVAAESCGEFVDYTKLGSLAQINRQSVARYFEILEDTLVVFRTNAFSRGVKKRLLKHPRFYFFDNGILNSLLRNFTVSVDRKGRLFENMFYSQLRSSAMARDVDIEISSYRTEHGAEVDFICEVRGEIIAIETKSSNNVGVSDLTGFKSFAEYYGKPFRRIVAYQGNHSKRIEDVDILPWQQVLQDIGL